MIRYYLLAILALLTLNLHATPKTVAKAKPKAPKISAAQSEADKLADTIQKHYNNTRSATFAFLQSYKNPLLPTNESSKGRVFFKANNMLWRYLEPADRQKEFYISGKKFTYHLVNDRIVYTHDCFDEDTLSASITFLLGKGKLKESFTITPYTGQKSNNTLGWLTLTPKEKNAPVKSISLGADKTTGMVKESLVIDQSNGVNHFVFSDFVVNKPIPDKTFIFQAPPGVKIQSMPNMQCPNTDKANAVKKAVPKK
jgi:outer membrane lipoprotein carrier protein